MLKKMLRQVTENRKPVCYSFQTQLGTQANSLSKSGDAVLIIGQREHGGIGRHTRLKILRSYDRGGSSPPARTTSQQIVQPREQMLCDCPLNLSSSPGQHSWPIYLGQLSFSVLDVHPQLAQRHVGQHHEPDHAGKRHRCWRGNLHIKPAGHLQQRIQRWQKPAGIFRERAPH